MLRFGKAFLIAGGLAALAACGGGDGGSAAQEGTETANAGAPATVPVEPSPTAAPAPAPDDVATKTGATLAQFTGDPAAGEKAFVQCRTCHVTEPGQNRIGPSLHNVVGRQAGSIPDFNYSEVHKNSGIVFSEEKLFQYLEDPQRVIPGNKMVFAGIADPQRRADLIAWLKTQ